MRAVPLAVLVTTSFAFACAKDKAANGKREALERVHRGSQLRVDGKYAEAIQELELAIRSNTLSRNDLSDAWTLVGLARQELDNLDGAIEAHTRSVEIRGDHHEAWVNLGIAQRLKGDLDGAEVSYRRALRLAPNYAEAHASLGAIYAFRGDEVKAIDVLERAVRLDDRLAVAHANLAIAYAMAGRYSDSDSALEKAVVRGYKNAAKARSRIDELKDSAGTDEASSPR